MKDGNEIHNPKQNFEAFSPLSRLDIRCGPTHQAQLHDLVVLSDVRIGTVKQFS